VEAVEAVEVEEEEEERGIPRYEVGIEMRRFVDG